MQTVEGRKSGYMSRGGRRVVRLSTVIGCAASVALMAGCRETAAKTEDQVRQQGSAPAAAIGANDVLATVGDEKITIADLRAQSGDKLDKLDMQYRIAKDKLLSAALDSMLREKTVGAEAKKTGKSVDQLIAAEAGPAGLEPSDADVAAWYKENQDRIGGRSLETIRPQILDLLRKERRRAAENKLDERLRAERKVVVKYEPFRFQFANDGAPTLGKKDAPITLVEFSDFQCPFCQRMAPTIHEVAKKYPDQVRIVYRQYPITSIHPFAAKAAEASLCAAEQGKFWELHDAMFADQTKLGVSDLKATAVRLGMNEKKFNTCLDSGRYVEQVQNDSKEAVNSGVTGTPAIFVNGITVDGGAVPMSVLEPIIQKELARVSATR